MRAYAILLVAVVLPIAGCLQPLPDPATVVEPLMEPIVEEAREAWPNESATDAENRADRRNESAHNASEGDDAERVATPPQANA